MTTTDLKDANAATRAFNTPLLGSTYFPQLVQWTRARIQSAASTNATSVKASAAILGVVHVTNINAALRYLKFYNKASAPTVGTDVPVWTIALPPSYPVNPVIPGGLDFATGIAYAITTGAADTDTGAVALNEIMGVIGYV